MKQLYKTALLIAINVFFITFSGYAQKDTTELKVGKKKLIIVDEKTQKENAIYNLQKAKESFEKEIAQTEKLIEQQKQIIEQQEKIVKQREDLIEQRKELIKKKEEQLEKDSVSAINTDLYNNEKINGLAEDKMKLLLSQKELETLKTEIEKQKLLIELNQKKQSAFENGIANIDEGIKNIREGISSLDKNLQNDKENHFRKEINAGNLNHSSFNAHWAGFEFGLLNFLDAKSTLVSGEQMDYMIIIPEKTMSYGLNILEYDIALSRNKRFGAATGAGLEWNSLALKQNINLYEDENGIIRAEQIDPSVTDYTKNKLNVVYVTVPLILEFQIPVKHRKFFIGAGLTGGIRAWSKQKQKYKVDGQTYKNKKTDDFQLASFRYGATARIGYGDIGFYINYSFVPLFKEGAGPEMFPISVGLKIVDF